ncbi:MAG: prolipoprotein diacylglyceryl transferase [Gracilibacter sp. BRH_c7a]|nr:MAG: prolipoprotein diacylglyceryl transferase [Gracilibacter sp. BRH_c7a]
MLQHFNLGGFLIHSYGLIVALAILLGLGVAYSLANQDKEYQNHLMDVVIFGLFGAIIGARIWQVFFYDWGYYSENLLQTVMIWKGGLSIQGGIVGAVIVGVLYSRIKRINFWRLADIAAPGLIFGQAIGRIACFLNGDAFGSPTGSDFGIVYPPGTYAYEVFGNQPLWPAEIWEGQINIVIFAVILILSRWKSVPQGTVFLAYVSLYSLNRFVLEFFRGDGSKYLLDLTSGQWTSIFVIAISLVVGFIILFRSRKALSGEKE